jgi:hypothetical protein
MDLNLYALELLARDRLARARAEARIRALVITREAPVPRVGVRVRLGLALMRLGRWLRGVSCSGIAGVRLEPQGA